MIQSLTLCRASQRVEVDLLLCSGVEVTGFLTSATVNSCQLVDVSSLHCNIYRIFITTYML